MIGKTRYAENAFLNYMFRDEAMTLPDNWYIGLFTAAPTDTTGGTEVAGGGYARQVAPRDGVTWLEATAGETSNLVDLLFAEASANYGSVVAVGIFDDLTAGHLWFAELLQTPQTINTGNQASFVAGQLAVAEE